MAANTKIEWAHHTFNAWRGCAHKIDDGVGHPAWKQRALHSLMGDISEACWCAGWMTGLEYRLWKIVSDPSAPRDCGWGIGTVSEQEIEDMRAISNEIGGWIRYDDSGPVFTPMAEWLKMFDDWRQHEREKSK